jgi:hypothetical protein
LTAKPAVSRAARFGILPLAALAAAIVPWPPAFVESIYSQGLYPRIQPVATTVSNLAPFAVLDALVLGFLLIAVWSGYRRWRRQGPVLQAVAAGAMSLAQLACLAYLWFLFLWGLNYQRPPASERFDADSSKLNDTAIVQAAHVVVRRVNETYSATRRADLLTARALEPRLAPAFAAAQRELGMNWRLVPGRPKWSFAGLLFPWNGVDGMMNPLALEVILNPEVLPFERPFVLAHEWGHLAGFAGESEASFVGWLACLSADRDARYSGWQAVLMHFLRLLPEADARRVTEALESGPSRDLAAVAARLRRRNPVAALVSWRVYDRYLKANRVETGVANYDEVVQLAISTPIGRSRLQQVPQSAR